MFKKQLHKQFHNKITFVGLGNMGFPMAMNLLKAGHSVSGFDSDSSVQNKFQENGGQKHQTLQTALENSDVLITMLPNGKIVKSVFDQSYNHLKKGAALINTSTISPIEQQEIGKEAKAKGFTCADAPVSGGVMGAQNATLSFMIGCDKEHFDKIKSILQPCGKNFFKCGEIGSGQVAKVCNNLCLAITMVGLSESLALGKKLGIDSKILSDIMSVSSARCWSVDTCNPVPGVMENVPASRDYERGFSNDLITKDVLIASDCAKRVGLDLEVTEKVIEHYKALKDLNKGNKDFSIVYQYILNNKKI
jgi:3-hydroxyisobutyrate dehydrogenase